MAQREFFNQEQHRNRPLTKQLDRVALKQPCIKQENAPEFVP